MSHVMGFIQYILGLGPSVMMPIIIFALSMAFRMPVAKGLRSALLIGIGFVAINLVIGLLVGALGPASQAMVHNLGVKLTVLDVGWPVASAVAFGTTSIVPWIFVLGIALNLGLIALKLVKTLDVDMWNYWHFIFGAAFVYAITGNFVLAIAVGLVSELVVLKLADFTAPIVQDYYKLPGISLPHVDTVSFSPVGWTLNKIIDRIPGLNRIQADPSSIQERFGVAGEPMVMGTVLGALIAVLAYYPQFGTDFGTAFGKVLTVAITLGAAMLVLPRMVGILMEGLVPLSDGAQHFIQDRFPGRDLYIGLDAAIVVGFPNNIATGLILVPITLILAVGMSLLGLNHVLPFTDLAVLPFFAVWANTWSRGNIVRGVIIGSVFIVVILTVATFLAAPQTQLAHAAGFNVPGATQMSSLDTGAHLVQFVLAFGFLLSNVSAYGTGFLVWCLFIVAATVASYIVYFIYIAKGHVPGMDDKDLYVAKPKKSSVEPVQRGEQNEADSAQASVRGRS